MVPLLQQAAGQRSGVAGRWQSGRRGCEQAFQVVAASGRAKRSATIVAFCGDMQRRVETSAMGIADVMPAAMLGNIHSVQRGPLLWRSTSLR
jgi:hypothetical protein